MHPSPCIELLRLDPDNNQDIPLPRYMTAQSSGMDICAALNDDLVLAPGRIGLVSTGFAMALAEGFEEEESDIPVAVPRVTVFPAELINRGQTVFEQAKCW